MAADRPWLVMPLADATAMSSSAPMITAMVSARVFDERAPRAVWVAVGLFLWRSHRRTGPPWVHVKAEAL